MSEPLILLPSLPSSSPSPQGEKKISLNEQHPLPLPSHSSRSSHPSSSNLPSSIPSQYDHDLMSETTLLSTTALSSSSSSSSPPLPLPLPATHTDSTPLQSPAPLVDTFSVLCLSSGDFTELFSLHHLTSSELTDIYQYQHRSVWYNHSPYSSLSLLSLPLNRYLLHPSFFWLHSSCDVAELSLTATREKKKDECSALVMEGMVKTRECHTRMNRTQSDTHSTPIQTLL